MLLPKQVPFTFDALDVGLEVANLLGHQTFFSFEVSSLFGFFLKFSPQLFDLIGHRSTLLLPTDERVQTLKLLLEFDALKLLIFELLSQSRSLISLPIDFDVVQSQVLDSGAQLADISLLFADVGLLIVGHGPISGQLALQFGGLYVDVSQLLNILVNGHLEHRLAPVLGGPSQLIAL